MNPFERMPPLAVTAVILAGVALIIYLAYRIGLFEFL